MNTSTRSATKRAELLQVASRLFYEQGYHQTGVQQIIAEAGAAKGTFYTHFKSKEELGLAWLNARHTTWNGWLQDAIRDQATARGKILGIFEFLGTWMEDCHYRGCAFLNTLCEMPDCDPAIRAEIANHKRELKELFQSLVVQHQPEAPESASRQLGTVLFLLFEGTLIELQNFREPWPLDGARQHVESLL